MALCITRPKLRFVRNPSWIHFSSASSSDAPPSRAEDDSAENLQGSSPSSPTQTSFSSYLSSVKSSLKNQRQHMEGGPHASFAGRPRQTPPSFSSGNKQWSGKPSSLDEIRKNLAEFRRRADMPPPAASSAAPGQGQPVSFQELYKRNVMANSGSSGAERDGRIAFESIRESLRSAKARVDAAEAKRPQPLSSSIMKSFNAKSTDNARSTVIGGTEALPFSVFGKEMEESRTKNADKGKRKFVREYSHVELGKKLEELNKGEGGFSLQELNERLMKLREKEDEEMDVKIAGQKGMGFQVLRRSLETLNDADAETKRKAAQMSFNILSQLGGTPNYMLHPPKEHLLENYFHPDNMSSAEKMKLELAKVREKFKTSESDCGSFRVQVALLTTKIKHLSSVLHKKDKHSRKGLQAMVQKRKKMLKYLRRKDWDSYCFVLSELRLRDNPDYKN